MSENKSCVCPVCSETFEPKEGVSPEEHLTDGFIQVLSQMQKRQQDGKLPCPRCGKPLMKPSLYSNALSRGANIYVCDSCGAEEAVQAMELGGSILPLSEWAMVKQFLGMFQSFKPNSTENVCIEVPYVSEWDGGTLIETTAKVNIRTGEVFDIKTANVGGLNSCDYEYIVMNDERVEVQHDTNGFGHYVDFNNKS